MRLTIIILGALLAGTTMFSILAGIRLYRWEKMLSRARIVIYFKNRRTMNPRLIDFVNWAMILQGDKANRGQVIYKQGGTTVAIQRALKPDKTTTKTVKDKAV